MSVNVTDPIADMLTRMRNATMVGHATTSVPYSKMKGAIARILKDEGFIEDFDVAEEPGSPAKMIRVKLKYVGVRREKRAVMTGMDRVSRPGRRVYVSKSDIPWVLSGMGVAILSTPKGVMTGQRARALGVGGELLCQVW
ncbi:MAG: 30S ribosomal protein S8 [Chloroflexi bacterium]|nr:30S ribosomal protein S8 [Chloroflexota bacterium]MBI5291645.1 30S ribosomal protein S8 [Chloroflexota bacterium]